MLKTSYQVSDTQVSIVKYDTESLVDKVPPAVYRVGFNKLLGQFFLGYVCDKFKLPEVIHGSTKSRSNKIVSTYEKSDKSIGVLLTGQKGAGKTLLAKEVANTMIDKGVPVVLIEDPYTGSGFFQFMSDLGETLNLFDEFAKMYDRDDVDQDEMLTFFDGATVQSKKLNFIIENRAHQINNFLINRPSRMLYHFDYDRIETEVVLALCAEYSLSDDLAKEVEEYVGSTVEMSFDILNMVISTMVSTGETLEQTVLDMNVPKGKYRPSSKLVVHDFTPPSRHTCNMTIGYTNVDCDGDIRVSYTYDDEEGNRQGNTIYFNLTRDDIKYNKDGSIIIKHRDEDAQIRYTEKFEKSYAF